jgi:hypothetical protein
LPSAPDEFFTVTPPVVHDLVIEPVGYLGFDRSAADGDMPEFAELPDASNMAAN